MGFVKRPGYIMTMPQGDDSERLRQLEERLKGLRDARAPVSHPAGEKFSQANMAWRMVIELVAGLGIGFGIGYGLDLVFGTSPFLMILFTLFGFAAGIKTVLRTGAEMGAKDGVGQNTGDGPSDIRS